MKITTPRCPFCGKSGEVELLGEQELRYLDWSLGIGVIKEALPDVSADVREQLNTGIHPECWDNLGSDDDEDEEES